MDKQTKTINWEQDFFIQYRILSAAKRVEFVSDRMSCIILIRRLCNITAVPRHQLTRMMIQNTVLYRELRQVFNHFPKYHMKIPYEKFMQNWGERILSNRQLGMRVYIRIVMIMVLE